MFQKQVYIEPGLAVAGDFASMNPRQHVVSPAPHGRLVAGEGGVTIGGFAFVDGAGLVHTTLPSGVVQEDLVPASVGFVARVIGTARLNFREAASMVIPEGVGVPLFRSGDYWLHVDAVEGSPTTGAPVFWNPTTGAVRVGGEHTAELVDTGFELRSAAAAVDDMVIIEKVRQATTEPAPEPGDDDETP